MDLTSEAANLQLVDFFPFLRPFYRYCPTFLMPYKQLLAKITVIEQKLFMQLMYSAKENIAAGKVYPSKLSVSPDPGLDADEPLGFIRDMLLTEDKDKLSDVEVANNAAHGFGAATFVNHLPSISSEYMLTANRDTQWNTTLGFVKAMILYPEVQAEAHREIDRVVGPDRLPVWEDRENMPYLRAIIEESLRCMNLSNLPFGQH
jgi:hypothetical protein